MKLSYTERIDIVSMLPAHASVMHLRAAKDIHGKVELTQADMTAVGMTEKDGFLGWDTDKEPAFDVDFTELEREVLAKALKALDEAEQLKPTHLPLYEEFVQDEAIADE